MGCKVKRPGKARQAVPDADEAVAAVAPGSDPAEYDRVLESFRARFDPSTVLERFLVEQIAHSQWKLSRLRVLSATAMHREPPDMNLLEQVQKWISAAEKTYARAYRQLMRNRSRKRPKAQPRPGLIMTNLGDFAPRA